MIVGLTAITAGTAFTPEFVEAARPCRRAPGDLWFVDETYLKVAGTWAYLYQALDQHGQRRVKSPLSRWNKHPPGKPRTCQRITKITTAIRAEHSPAATRRQQCVTTASGL